DIFAETMTRRSGEALSDDGSDLGDRDTREADRALEIHRNAGVVVFGPRSAVRLENLIETGIVVTAGQDGGIVGERNADIVVAAIRAVFGAGHPPRGPGYIGAHQCTFRTSTIWQPSASSSVFRAGMTWWTVFGSWSGILSSA